MNSKKRETVQKLKQGTASQKIQINLKICYNNNTEVISKNG